MTRSLLGRIVLRLCVATALALLCAYAWLYAEISSTADALRSRALQEQAIALADAVTLDADARPRVTVPAEQARIFAGTRTRFRYALRDGNGEVAASSHSGMRPPPSLEGEAERAYAYDPDGLGPVHVFGVVVARSVEGRPFTVQVEQLGTNDDWFDTALTEEFLRDGGWLILPFLLTLLGVSVLTVRNGLAPVARLSRLAAEVGPDGRAVRLPARDVPSEIVPLVSAVNLAFDRLEDGFRRQREFTADAAHQLRTPLAALGAQVDTLADRAAAARLREDVDLMSRTVAQLLLIARVDAEPFGAVEEVDLARAAEEVAAALAPLAVSQGKLIEVEAVEGVAVRADALAIQGALTNLVENALAHTPAGTAVRVRVAPGPRVEVSDEGEGIPPALRAKVFERFWRGDRNRPGAGLGLSIVERAMRALGGRVAVGDAPGGGATFTLLFPSPPRAASPLRDAPRVRPSTETSAERQEHAPS